MRSCLFRVGGERECWEMAYARARWQVRLKFAYVITCEEVIKDADGKVVASPPAQDHLQNAVSAFATSQHAHVGRRAADEGCVAPGC